MEVTNESRGWHLHFHFLIETRWIEIAEVSKKWAKLLGQDTPAVVKVKDARMAEYLKEVTKYVCKSEDVASWDGHDIAELFLALRGRRSFSVFGKLFGQRQKWKQEIRTLRRERSKCECGGNDWTLDACCDVKQLAKVFREFGKSVAAARQHPPERGLL